MLYFHGDIHGHPVAAFSFKQHPWMRTLNEHDYLFVLGDCGVPWNEFTIEEDLYQLNWLNAQKYKTVFIAGNHDNYDLIEQMPQISFFGGTARVMTYQGQTYDNILYIDYPTYIEIQGKKILIIPGAESHDIFDGIIDGAQKDWRKQLKAKNDSGKIYCRVSHITWWEQEKIKEQETLALLNKIPESIDYILSHDCPAIQLQYYRKGDYIPTSGEELLEYVWQLVNHKIWLHGHLHEYIPNYRENIIGIFSNFLDEDDINYWIKEHEEYRERIAQHYDN